MKSIIIDDEEQNVANVFLLLQRYCPHVEVVGKAYGRAEGIKIISEHTPELLFLDVELKDGTGFDILRAFPDRTFQVIFITGHNDFAIKAFRFSAIDYLLKPIDADDLIEAVRRVERISGSDNASLAKDTLLANEQSARKKLVLSDADNIHLVEVDCIMRCEAEGNYTRFYLRDGKSILISRTLKEYEELFADFSFLR
ncbi:MAG: LytTR family DNA-binding domain-containing protein, partial [Bacteroidota bacterium]